MTNPVQLNLEENQTEVQPNSAASNKKTPLVSNARWGVRGILLLLLLAGSGLLLLNLTSGSAEQSWNDTTTQFVTLHADSNTGELRYSLGKQILPEPMRSEAEFISALMPALQSGNKRDLVVQLSGGVSQQQVNQFHQQVSAALPTGQQPQFHLTLSP